MKHWVMPCPIALPDANTGMAPRNVRSRFAGTRLQRSRSNGSRCFAQWLENSAEQDVHLPVERCYEMWEDRERIPQWMPWIQSVKVLSHSLRSLFLTQCLTLQVCPYHGVVRHCVVWKATNITRAYKYRPATFI